MTYEEAFAKLEEISIRLANKDLGLEEATKLFEEALNLTKICYEKLKTTEGKLLVYEQELEALKPLDIQ